MASEVCLVLGVKKFQDFVPEGQKEALSGAKVVYLTGDIEQSPDRVGTLPMTVKGDVTLWASFSVVPGFYDLDLTTRPDGMGNPVLRCRGAVFVAGVEYARRVAPVVAEASRPTQIKQV